MVVVDGQGVGRVPHVGVSAGTVVMMLGMILLIVQPGAIPFAYAMTTRHVRRGGQRPTFVAVGTYLLGCLFTLICVSAFFCADFPMMWAVVLGYGPMWLYGYLLLRQPEARPAGRHLRS
ncbi:hypothetical protein [Actinoplanes sp. HUAS TT8]|uniref:hypothetical protein n=1 Tax=Actinoplanes sp. HUAS TT8 TaxID=3447453 RepID=UPI003F520C1E